MGRGQYELRWDSREDRDVLEIVQAFADLRRRRAELEFARIARQGTNRTYLQSPSGWGGEVRAQIHPTSYHYWGQRLGYDCWKDDAFMREYLRDNPYARVQNRARRLTVTVPAAAPARKRFSKTYLTETTTKQ